jgi:hypothetical protein
MNSDYHVIDALIDQEDVDVDRLRRVLDDRDARDYLIDACLLRRAVLTEGLDPSDAAVPRSKSAPPGRRVVLSLAVAASLALAFVAGRASGPAGPIVGERPGSAVTAPVADHGTPAFPAPAATRVIQVEFASGTSGGN